MTARHIEVPSPLRQLKKRLPNSVKSAARGAARAIGSLTSHQRVLPDFAIIGTKRGGTTSLWNYLVGHPDVLPMFPAAQEIKSPHYFDIHFDKGLDWYRAHFARESTMSRARSTDRNVVTGEASPYYMFHPLAAARMADVVPDIKLIVSLRHPVERAYSHYSERSTSTEELPSFEAAIAAEDRRLSGEEQRIIAEPGYYSHHHDNSSYLARGRYAEQLERWHSFFPQNQIHVLITEEMHADPGREYGKVCSFLEIEPPAHHNFPRYNQLPRTHISPDTRAHLSRYFKPHNERLADLLSRTLPWDGANTTSLVDQ